MSIAWYTGICDDLYRKIVIWNSVYWMGEVHSTRKFLDKTGEVIDKPTRCAHRIPFRQNELEHLIRIASELRPNSALLEELEKVRAMWKYGSAVQGNRYNHSYWKRVLLPPGLHRVITLAFYPEHAKDVMAMLMEAKLGKPVDVDAMVKDKQAEGKDLFEL